MEIALRRISATDSHGTSARISIADDRQGGPSEPLPLLFQPLYRVPGDGIQNSGDTGFGQAIDEKIAQLHHGTIYAVNRAGDGLVVHLKLPLDASGLL